MSSLLPLPVWTVGGRLCPFQRCEPFLCSAPWARTRCWGPSSRPPSGPPRAGPPLALASRDTARECCLQNRELAQWCWFYLVRPVWTFQCYTFKLHQLLVILPAQCDFFPVFLQEIFVGFRYLTNSSWNLQHQKTKKTKQKPSIMKLFDLVR